MKLRVTELIAKLEKENFSKLSISTMDSHQLPGPICLLSLGIAGSPAHSSLA